MTPQATPSAKRARRPDSAPKTAIGDGRGEILIAALKAFANDTFDGASLPEIARDAGVGTPLIHYHFGTKEKLWQATVAHAFEDLERPLNAIVSASRDFEPVDGLKLLCRALIQFAAKYPEHVLVLVNEARSPGLRLDWLIENHLRRVHAPFDLMIERAAAAGQIKPIPPVHLTNMIIESAVHFYAAAPLIRTLYGVNPDDLDVASAHGDWLIEILFRGIQTPSAGRT